jgi:hypothetical protein
MELPYPTTEGGMWDAIFRNVPPDAEIRAMAEGYDDRGRHGVSGGLGARWVY